VNLAVPNTMSAAAGGTEAVSNNALLMLAFLFWADHSPLRAGTGCVTMSARCEAVGGSRGEPMHRVQVLDARGVARVLERMAAELVEHVGDEKLLYFVGVQTRGVPLARRLAKLVASTTGHQPPVGALDITLYRDDVGPWRAAHQQPVLRDTDLPAAVDAKVICLVDDVLYTGRTVRAALDTLMDYGRPKAIRLAVLVDRGHRELPIAADFVGRVVPTSRAEDVQVRLKENDDEEGVWIAKEVAG
jgi:pyrimidine operon attenuation protein/uracil phosphoribosyltransferase